MSVSPAPSDLGGGTAIPLPPPTSIARNPRFSRDGKMIVYQREENLQWDLWIVDLEDGTQHQLTKTRVLHRNVQPGFHFGVAHCNY